MYFRGSWKKPFDVVEPGMFYKSNTLKKQVPMMKTIGIFKTGPLPGLDSTAIELPYDVRILQINIIFFNVVLPKKGTATVELFCFKKDSFCEDVHKTP